MPKATEWRVKAGRDVPKPFTIAAAAAGKFAVRAAEDAPDGGGKKKLPTFTMLGYTGDVMTPGGWYLPIIVDLDGVRVPSETRPILRQHDPLRIVGHSTKVTVDEDGISATGVMSGVGPDCDEVCRLSANGFPWQASIGANPIRTEFLEAGETATVNGREVTGPMTISRETELGEISFVPLGADGNTSATVTASRKKVQAMTHTKKKLKLARKRGVKAAQQYSDEDIAGMDEEEAKAALKECMADADADETEKKDDVDAEGDDVDADEPSDVDADEDVDADGEVDAEDEEPKKADANRRKPAIRAYRGTAARILAGRKMEAKEARRVAGIKAKCRTMSVGTVRVEGRNVDLDAHAIEAGWSVEKVELHALRAGRPAAGVGQGQHVYSTTSPRVTDAVLECAVLQAAGGQYTLDDDDSYFTRGAGRSTRIVSERDQKRVQAANKARYPDQVQQAAHTLFKGRIGLQQMLSVAAAQNGYRGREVLDDDGIGNVLRFASQATRGNAIQADGASSASLVNILSNVLNKFLLQGYLFVDQSWKEVAGVRPVKDFKPTKSVNLFGDTMFEKTGSAGELKNAVLGDQAFANQADQYGKILTIDRKQIINDDLGALTTVPMQLGRGAALKLNQLFWTTFMDATQKDDGGSTAFFAATHTIAGQKANSNYLTGAGSALSSASLRLAQTLFDKQVDPVGYPLGVDPAILLYPPELDTTAWELMNSEFIVYGGASAAKQGDRNQWKGRFNPVKCRYLSNPAIPGNSATAWQLLANPALLPVVEVCFLNGQESPTIQQSGVEYQFDKLGISIRGVFDFGVAMQNFRGGVFSAGV